MSIKTSKIDQKITDLELEVEQIQEELDRLDRFVVNLHKANSELKINLHTPPEFPKRMIKDHCLSVSFDLWPLSDWVRLGWSRSKNNYTQLTVGPFRVDWFV